MTPKKAPEKKKKEAEPEEKAAPVAAGSDRSEPASSRDIGTTALSPAVRRIVEEEKLEPERIRGTGEGGRVTKGDVLAAVEERAAEGLPAVASAEAGRLIRKKMSPLRRKIAQQLVMAQHTAAILTLPRFSQHSTNAT